MAAGGGGRVSKDYFSPILTPAELPDFVRESSPHNALLLLEHTSVFTVGVRSREQYAFVPQLLASLRAKFVRKADAGSAPSAEKHFADPDDEPQSGAADYVETNRGGLITYHGPGQLVAYPILNLVDFAHVAEGATDAHCPSALPLRQYVSLLEAIIIRACQTFGLNAHRYCEPTKCSSNPSMAQAAPIPPTPTEASRPKHMTGVWLEGRKLASIGVHAGQNVTTHGLALNCSTNLGWFALVSPCGLDARIMSSLSRECARRVSVDAARMPLADSFAHLFRARLELQRPPAHAPGAGALWNANDIMPART